MVSPATTPIALSIRLVAVTALAPDLANASAVARAMPRPPLETVTTFPLFDSSGLEGSMYGWAL